jgi:putative transposase
MTEPFRHKGWHSRGYLPHLDAAGEIQALTFRLADALPAKVVAGWKKEMERDPAGSEKALRIKIARYEDAGHGSCLLRVPVCAEIVQNAFLHFDGIRYRLLEWCVMPNHVHVLIHCCFNITLGEIIRSWKTYTAREISKHTGDNGKLWALDYFDRYIRDLDHLADARSYIRNNPVKAGLCQRLEDWPWSSASQPPDRERLGSPVKE